MKKIYWQTILKKALGIGIPVGVASLSLLFIYLSFLGVIDVTGHSGDTICAGTELDPCYAYINFTAKENIFIYPVGYDPWGRDTPFYTDEGLKSWTLQRSWGDTWRTINLSKTWSSKVRYAVKFAKGQNYQIRIMAYKENPYEDIKWGFGPVDPAWFGIERDVGYEFLDDGKVVHIWNTQDDYFFNKTSGIQFTNHYEDYWTRNIFCLGYYSGDSWNKVKCADELNGFNKDIQTDNLTYVNATLWKDFIYGDYDLRLGVRYHLGLDDKKLSVIVYGKNIGIDIPYDLGFAWKVTDWEIPHEGNGGDAIRINNTDYELNGTFDILFKNMTRTYVNYIENEATGEVIGNETIVKPIPFFRGYDYGHYLTIDWNENLNYAVRMVGNGNQEDFYVALLINAGIFNAGQEKSTTFYWIDAEWDISTAVYLQEFSVAAKETLPKGVFFKPDGTKMYIAGDSGNSIDEYDLSTAWNVTTATYLQEFSLALKETSVTGVFFKPDGTKMYTVGYSGDTVDEYDLSTAWNVTAAVYLQEFSVLTEDSSPQGVFFKPDGTRMYVAGGAGTDVNEYNLTTVWNVTTAVYLQKFSLAGEASLTGVFFKPDGTKMYACRKFDTHTMEEYDLSTAWNVTTATYLQNFYVGDKEETLEGVFFNSSGTRMYTVGRSGDSVDEYDLPEAEEDTTPPTYSNNQTNTTEAGTSCLFSILYDDDVALHWGGQYIFSTNNTGTWVNESAVNFTATPQWANVTKTLNSTVGTVVGYRWYADDNTGKINNTEIFTLTIVDTIPPTFVSLNEAGNPEENSFGTDTSNKYYRNGTWQTENWINISVNVSDNVAVDTVFVEWKNETTWKNYTMNNLGNDVYSIRISDQPSYNYYTFNIWANDTSGNMAKIYNWTFYDYVSGWGAQEQWRKYVGLNAEPEEFAYEQFYHYNASYSIKSYRVLPHEQPSDGTLFDTGLAYYASPTVNQERYCISFIGFFIDETIKMNDTAIDNIYIHTWWGTDENTIRVGYEKERDVSAGGVMTQYYDTSSSLEKMNVSLSGFTQPTYRLEAKFWDIANPSFEDNEINLFDLKYSTGGNPSVMSFINNTHKYQSFFILNIPDNTTLQGLDSDSDGVNDYVELFEYWTDPKSNDTDGDGYNDNVDLFPLDPNKGEPTIDIDYHVALPLGVIRFLNCSPDFENSDSRPDGQTSTIAAINATNNGTGIATFTINLTGTLNTGWTIWASNDSLVNNITLSTTAQTIWSGVAVDETKKIWLAANCSYVSANPGKSITMWVV